MVKYIEKEFRNVLMGFSMLLIIMTHLSGWHDGGHIGNLSRLFFKNGGLGVDVFMFLSAYGLCFSYSENSLFVFYRNRVKRIYPLYIIYFTIGVLFFFQVKNIAITFILQFLGLSLLSPDIHIDWYVPAIILLYAFFPLIFKIISFCYRKHKISMYVLPCLCYIVFLFFFRHFRYDYSVVYLLAKLPSFISGIVYYLCFKQQDSHTLMSFMFVCCAMTIIDFSFPVYPYIPLMLTTICQVIPQTSNVPVIQQLGKYSFEIYLAQNLSTKYIYQNLQGSIIQDSLITTIYIVAFSVLFVVLNKFITKVINVC